MSRYSKSNLVDVEHPDFELHDLTSLAIMAGYHPTNAIALILDGRIKIEASKFSKANNHILITKAEADRLRAMGEKRRARG